ncbi:alpha/beta hydrolase [Luteimicrobium album]|uniref:Alpha/beta hydrolase n=1 Tax=Luteimicrobium album TaxID=1054550 RepID=A0ABQ6I0B3_9MICO|nr:alpha/beta hydrolase [Luteimicrobium album]GMA24057.1 alpha/beta hydrolase [Luteimicrobium album]
MIETEVGADDGRRLHVYDSVGGPAPRVVYWLHGSGMSGLPPTPLLDAADALGVRVVAHDRPGYGASGARPGRSVADGAADVVTVLDALGIASAGVLGLSAGGMHALAAAALAPERVLAAAVLGCPAPFGAVGLDWFAGMSEANRAEFDAALRGADALRAHLGTAELDPSVFAPEDLAAMHGPFWEWQLAAAGADTTEGVIEDELASLSDWGFRLDSISAPTLLVHGTGDTFVPVSHARWLAAELPASTLRTEPGGHISTIPFSSDAMTWLASRTAAANP